MPAAEAPGREQLRGGRFFPEKWNGRDGPSERKGRNEILSPAFSFEEIIHWEN